ncbi:MAG: RNA-binding protein [Clostridiales bacterium]|nr:RNA-binding protein [Clostridiales bacterium]
MISKRGRDQRKFFVVIGTAGEYAFIADGDSRRLAKPKKKKFKHLQPTNSFAEELLPKLNNGQLLDADIRKVLYGAKI